MTIAHASPRLVILRCTEVISPETVTVDAVGAVLVEQQLADGAVAPTRTRMCSRPSSGWSET